MLSTSDNLIVIDDVIRTEQIDSCRWDAAGRYHIVFNGGTKEYLYGSNRVLWLTDPVSYDPNIYRVVHNGQIFRNVSEIYKFSGETQTYWHICFANGSKRDYKNDALKVYKSCLTDSNSKDIFQYLKQIADANALQGDDNTSLLSKQYAKIDFIDDTTAVASYFNPAKFTPKRFGKRKLIYPFGCNASQLQAVQAAFEHQISVIQGPPGTGKTQTILNIIANILVAKQSVLVVSNNNSAIDNILEKLNKYELGFLVATLGNSENKQTFIDAQKNKKQYPNNIRTWHCPDADKSVFLDDICRQSDVLKALFAKQERLAKARQELLELDTERQHFVLAENNSVDNIQLRKLVYADKLVPLWLEFQMFAESKQRLSKSFFVFRFVLNIKWLLLKLKSRRLFSGLQRDFFKRDMALVLSDLQIATYNARSYALRSEIESLETYLSQQNAAEAVRILSDMSMQHLKNTLYRKYIKNPVRQLFDISDLKLRPQAVLEEYLVVLSTTFSARNCLASDTVYDYVIMDEASQVSIDTGALALSCARNAVIVGDSMQLPNVITSKDKTEFEQIETTFDIADAYKCTRNSFLESVCRAVPDICQTLLREHYRCHPKIIEFCNRKFYGGNLVIMTHDNGEPDVLCAIRTVEGNHARDQVNRREIDVIKEEVLPTISCDKSDIGIIAPYNRQVGALCNAIGDSMDIATVHKFQGREKDAIIMSVVDNRITDFADDANLLNVAVSRAKQKFCLVVNGNEGLENSNIGDLLAYIEYNNFKITHSKIRSIFDYLYKQYTETRIKYLESHPKVSDYASENLLYSELADIMQNHKNCDVVCHFPLRLLIRDASLLDDEERRYVGGGLSHVDFLIYNRVSKFPILAVEVDGYRHHLEGSHQKELDDMKDRILAAYGIPLERLSTTGSNEKQRIENRLKEILR